MEVGYKRIIKFEESAGLSQLEKILRKFHNTWLIQNEKAYKEGAINSASLTKNGSFLESADRLSLLKIVSSEKIVTLARKVLGKDIRFLNTQLFFNPLSSKQPNYWHRDIQYTGMPEEEQRRVIENKQSQVIHLRLALAEENGVEFIANSHFRWDSIEEFNIRFNQNGKKTSDNIAGADKISLQSGDLLVFDANIIHRGIYGKDRFSFDILFCRAIPELMCFIEKENLPSESEMRQLSCPEIFLQSF